MIPKNKPYFFNNLTFFCFFYLTWLALFFSLAYVLNLNVFPAHLSI